MEQDRISEKQKASKQKLVRKKGWFVPSIHGEYLESEGEFGERHGR